MYPMINFGKKLVRDLFKLGVFITYIRGHLEICFGPKTNTMTMYVNKSDQYTNKYSHLVVYIVLLYHTRSKWEHVLIYYNKSNHKMLTYSTVLTPSSIHLLGLSYY